MPRVVNLTVAACLLLFLVPLFTHLGDVSTSVRVLLLVIAVPFALMALLCVASAARPGSVARMAKRVKPPR